MPLWSLIHIAGTHNGVVDVNVLTAYQQGDKGAAQRTAIGGKKLPVQLISDIHFNLFHFIQFRDKGCIFCFIKTTVAYDQCIKVLLQILQYMSEISFDSKKEML